MRVKAAAESAYAITGTRVTIIMEGTSVLTRMPQAFRNKG